MRRRSLGHLSLGLLVLFLGMLAPAARPQSASTYIPGVTYQTENPNYFKPNPFYFEGRIDWNLLKLDQPVNAWDYMQHGIYNQDDLQNIPAAIADYQKSVSMNSLSNGTCQIVTGPVPSNGNLTPAPCMFTVRLRLAGLLKDSDPAQAITLYTEVLKIDPLKLSVHAHLAQVYASMAAKAVTQADQTTAYQHAITEYQAELALSPVTPVETQVTGDTANNAHVHWELAQVYESLGQSPNQMNELQLYLAATRWHSDVYPWRTSLARQKVDRLQKRMHLQAQ